MHVRLNLSGDACRMVHLKMDEKYISARFPFDLTIGLQLQRPHVEEAGTDKSHVLREAQRARRGGFPELYVESVRSRWVQPPQPVLGTVPA